MDGVIWRTNNVYGTFNFMIVFQAKHNILMHHFHMLGVASVFGNTLFNVIHGSLVTSCVIKQTIQNEYASASYKFGQKEETYNIVADHDYFGHLILQYASFINSSTCLSHAYGFNMKLRRLNHSRISGCMPIFHSPKHFNVYSCIVKNNKKS